MADTRQLGGWYADRIAAGTAFGEPRRARDAAIGEAIERYCGNLLTRELRTQSHASLTSAGHRALGPDDLPRWSPEQLTRKGFSYLALTELVERDAMVTWWYSGAPAVGIELGSIPDLAARWEACPLHLHLVRVPTDLALPVVGAYVWDPRTAVPAAGFSAGPTATAAASKAAQEALQVWISTSGLTTREGPSWRAIENGTFAAGVYLPYRDDLAYLDDAGEDFRAIRDLAAQTQLWLDPRLHHLAHRFTDPPQTVEVDEIPDGDIGPVVDELVRRGTIPVAFDLTSIDVAEAGAATVRVLAPGLQPNAPAAYQYLGTDRLHTRRRELWPTDPPPPILAPPPHN